VNFGDAIALVRPRQWTKNLAVVAPLVFAGRLLDLRALELSLFAFVAFCFVSSAVYSINDVVDAERDRQHPVKQDRPVAAGRMSSAQALLLAAVLLGAGLSIGLLVDAHCAIALCAYFALQLLYIFALKNLLIVDMIVVAIGFVVRAITGAMAINVSVSPWFVLCTGLLALFLAIAKRRHEIVLLHEHSDSHRPVLSEYSAELLDSYMVTLSASTITAYALYTFTTARTQYYWMMMSIPFVIFGILRYQYLVLRKGRGGRPEEILLSDTPLMVDIVLWTVYIIVVRYVIHRYVS